MATWASTSSDDRSRAVLATNLAEGVFSHLVRGCQHSHVQVGRDIPVSQPDGAEQSGQLLEAIGLERADQPRGVCRRLGHLGCCTLSDSLHVRCCVGRCKRNALQRLDVLRLTCRITKPTSTQAKRTLLDDIMTLNLVCVATSYAQTSILLHIRARGAGEKRHGDRSHGNRWRQRLSSNARKFTCGSCTVP
jgi:hypothetical protein